MAEYTLTPLEGIAGFTETIRNKLANPYWITTAEEFRSTVRCHGRKPLATILGVDEAAVGVLADAVNALNPDSPFDTTAEFEVGDGLVIEGIEGPGPFDAVATELPDTVEPLTKAKHTPEPADQGRRNTCVAFTLAAITQILSGDPADLSEQFLYYLCKKDDGIPGDAGTRPDLALKLLEEQGICTEATWPYVKERNDAQPGGLPPPPAAYTEAKLRRISGFKQLPKGAFGLSHIQVQLAQGKPVMIGMPIYEHWTGATQATLLGRLRFPLPGEQQRGGHAMCVVGYRNDASAPGGGYFIVRNSWGTSWAKDNPDGPGYCHIPFLLVARQGLVVFAVDGVVESVSKPAAPPAKAAGGKASQNVRRGARLGGSGAGGDTLMLIYTDLLALRDEVDNSLKDRVGGLADRLQTLVGLPAPEVLPQEPEPASTPDSASGTEADQPTSPTPEAQSDTPVAEPEDAPPPTRPYSRPIFYGESTSKSEDTAANGVDGERGQLLLVIDQIAAAQQAKEHGKDPPELEEVFKTKESSASFPTVFGVDQNSVQEAHWAVVVSSEESVDLLKAIWPLIDHRMEQMGFSKRDFDFQSGDTSCGAWLNRHTDGGGKNLKDNWGEVPPVLLVRPGEIVDTWLHRHGTSQNLVDPANGVPFYLLILGRPGPLNPQDQAFISFHFQFELDVYWGVGRLIFSDENGLHRLGDYRTYAERVVAWEKRQDAADRLRREIGFFATRHEDDNSTIRSADEMVDRLIAWSKTNKIAVAQGIGQSIYIHNDATKDNLGRLLSASSPPALLFTASHGIGLPLNDPKKLVLNQGALVTADFQFGSIKPQHWLPGADLDSLSNANLDGMIAFLFACYGAGCPQNDEFVFDTKKPRLQIAPFPFVAQLPQRMLVKGALAVVGHGERAWTYTFSGTEGTKSQIQPFQDVIGSLLAGKPIGSATDHFNFRQASLSLTLTQEIERGYEGSIPDPAKLARLWMARNDARNYILLGDPAVKLPF